MKRTGKKWIILFVLLTFLAGAVVMLREYFRTPSLLTGVRADWVGTATELAAAFRLSEQDANTRFLGKIIEVKGVVDNVSSEGDSIYNVTLGSPASGNVSCTMDPSYNHVIRQLRLGDTVSIRGECAGFLADVELSRCVMVK